MATYMGFVNVNFFGEREIENVTPQPTVVTITDPAQRAALQLGCTAIEIEEAARPPIEADAETQALAEAREAEAVFKEARAAEAAFQAEQARQAEEARITTDTETDSVAETRALRSHRGRRHRSVSALVGEMDIIRDLSSNFDREISHIENVCKNCGKKDVPACCSKPNLMEIKHYLIKRKIKYRALLLAMIVLAFMDEGVLHSLTSNLSKISLSTYWNASNGPANQPTNHNIALNLMNMTEELYFPKNDSEMDLLTSSLNATNETKPTPQNATTEEMFDDNTEGIINMLLSSFFGQVFNVTEKKFNTSAIPLTLFHSHFEKMHQFEDKALYFFSSQLLKGILVPIVMTEIVNVGYHSPLYKGCFLLISSLIFYAYAFFVNYPAWSLVLCTILYSAGATYMAISAFCLLAQVYPEETLRTKIISLILSAHAAGVMYGFYVSDALVRNMWDIIVWCTLIILFTVLLSCLAYHIQWAKRAASYSFQIIHLSANCQNLIKIHTNRTIFFMFFVIQVAAFNMKNLESTLNIWVLPYLKHELLRSSFNYMPNVLGYILGALMSSPFFFRLRHMQIFFFTLMFNGLITILLPFAGTMPQFLHLQMALGFGNGFLDIMITIYLSTLANEHLTARIEHQYVFCYFFAIIEFMRIGGHMCGTLAVQIYLHYLSLGSMLELVGLGTFFLGFLGLFKFKTLNREEIEF